MIIGLKSLALSANSAHVLQSIEHNSATPLRVHLEGGSSVRRVKLVM